MENKNNLTAYQKLEKIMEYLQLNSAEFAQKLGISPTKIYDIKRGQIKNLSAELMEKILQVYPSIEGNYLITGEGPMLRNGSHATTPSSEQTPMGDATKAERRNNDPSAELAQLKRTLSQLQDYNDMLKAENKRLQKELEKKHNSTSELMSEDTI